MRGTSAEQAIELRKRATEARLRDLRMVYEAGLGHIGGEFSALDILTVLYHAVLRIDPQRPDWPERDRFILSKGHAAAALYTTLAGAGFIDVAELDTFLAPLSRLNGHPDRKKVPGVETNTGPLGHGFPVAVGAALAGQLDGSERRTFVLCGDGELQEGSMWEAAMAGAHFGLERLTLIVDRNGLQQGDATERTMRLDPLADRFRAFGWAVREVDGHDHAALLEALHGAARRAGEAQLPHRAHAQGPRRLLHQRPGRLAPPRAHGRRVRARPGGAGGAARGGRGTTGSAAIARPRATGQSVPA